MASSHKKRKRKRNIVRNDEKKMGKIQSNTKQINRRNKQTNDNHIISYHIKIIISDEVVIQEGKGKKRKGKNGNDEIRRNE
ncbi:hypothetical protein Glove_11g37 [Diversispora epigaea]|uniref:Uncharacterized protein n=1 Tax=Diversispora epigaea TaxID=1348612 RepID=A0A397JUI5_9GLOM|nr:hypothetical protein Glove_11g38 [Diversispora epigaea]RHZ89732.1 hypothetical protein Glove_11g37 [Diversispora epigaea]